MRNSNSLSKVRSFYFLDLYCIFLPYIDTPYIEISPLLLIYYSYTFGRKDKLFLPMLVEVIPAIQMEEHEKALSLLVHKLRDYPMAQEYCEQYSKGKGRVYRQTSTRHCSESTCSHKIGVCE